MLLDDDVIVVEPWTRQMGAVWAQLLAAQGVGKSAIIVELAPGVSPKVGCALETLGFRGRLHVVDASCVACRSMAGAYRRLLPDATIYPVVARLGSAIPSLPAECDALLMNHALDDLILGHSLSEGEFNEVFDWAVHPPSVERVRQYWRRAARNGDTLARCAGGVHDDLIRIIERCQPRLIVIAEYRSWIHKTYKLDEPERHARMLARRLGVSLEKHGRTRCRSSDPMLADVGHDPSNWLIYKWVRTHRRP
jgi:hypothetical protein